MSKTIIFDIQLGASGDMLLGALLDLDLDIDILLSELMKIDVQHWSISPEKIIKKNIRGLLANVKCQDDKHSRTLNEIKDIINISGLSEKIKKDILKIFQRLAIAEAAVHGIDVDKVHFHEIGAIDTIIDISAFCISLDILGIEEFYFNDFCYGTGIIESDHGELPIPVPAVIELTKLYKSRTTKRSGEIVTPTAAAILTTLGSQLNENLSFTIINSGTGFGTRNYPFTSYTRAFLVEIDDNHKEEILQLECNIDDMNPQVYPDIIKKLLDTGALDVYISQITMKKGRPGTKLTVIANKETLPTLKKIIYLHTTTLGIRIFNITREKLYRTFEMIHLHDHNIRIKIGYYNNEIVNIQPEFEDCKTVADKTGLPIKEIIVKALEEYGKRPQ